LINVKKRVYIGCGCIHSVAGKGDSTHIAWNKVPKIEEIFGQTIDRYQINNVIEIDNIIHANQLILILFAKGLKENSHKFNV